MSVVETSGQKAQTRLGGHSFEAAHQHAGQADVVFCASRWRQAVVSLYGRQLDRCRRLARYRARRHGCAHGRGGPGGSKARYVG
jgi:hypothetical protein